MRGRNWRKWFAWYPIKDYIGCTWAWLETVERRFNVGWEYRVLDRQKP